MDIAAKETRGMIVPMGDNLFFNEEKFVLAQRVAKVFAESTMVPEHFQGNLGNCIIALNFAARIGADPFMVFQNMYVVHGRPGIEGKLVIALINACGRFLPIKFRHENENTDKWKCTAYTTEIKSGEELSEYVDWGMVVAEGWNVDKQNPRTGRTQKSKWNTLRRIMFQYRSAAFFARAYCPEVLLGMLTRDELEDAVDLVQGTDGRFEALDLKEKTKAQIASLKEKLHVTEDPHAQDPSASPPEDTGEAGPAPIEIPSHPWARDNWIKLRSGNGKTTGLAGYYAQHHETLKAAPQEIIDELFDKWASLYGAETCPFSASGTPLERTESPQAETSAPEAYQDMGEEQIASPESNKLDLQDRVDKIHHLVASSLFTTAKFHELKALLSGSYKALLFFERDWVKPSRRIENEAALVRCLEYLERNAARATIGNGGF